MSIQANELRIGNLFYDVDSTLCYYAGSWQRNDGWIHRDSANNTYKEQEMFPIPLTPEILEKCGFKKYRDGNYYCEELGLIELDFNDITESYYLEYKDVYLSTEINYLHQLQNLYFALSGEELQINL